MLVLEKRCYITYLMFFVGESFCSKKKVLYISAFTNASSTNTVFLSNIDGYLFILLFIIKYYYNCFLLQLLVKRKNGSLGRTKQCIATRRRHGKRSRSLIRMSQPTACVIRYLSARWSCATTTCAPSSGFTSRASAWPPSPRASGSAPSAAATDPTSWSPRHSFCVSSKSTTKRRRRRHKSRLCALTKRDVYICFISLTKFWGFYWIKL